jgi:hypothetical protein
MQVPQYDFVSKSKSFGDGGNDGGPALGTSAELQRLTMSAASGLPISQIQFPIANASYELEYFAPAISCAPAPSPIVERVTGWLKELSAVEAPWLSFVSYNLNLVPANYTPLTTQDTLATTFFGTGYNFNSNNQSASLVVAMKNKTSSVFSYPIVECTLQNASYHTSFQFTYPSQNVSVTQRTLHGVILTPSSQSDAYGTPEWAYMNIMDAFANILVGFSTASGGGEVSYKTNYQVTALNNFTRQNFDNDQLGSLLESIFLNITLSLLSDPSFQ